MLRFRRTPGLGGSVAELLAIAVTPQYQQQGVGRRLLDAIESLARRRASAIFLNTAMHNVTAQRFYSAAGFVTVGSHDRFYPAGQPAVDMRKIIDSPRRP
jgi:ribosomal-protein-alanine N-acetyltransferase